MSVVILGSINMDIVLRTTSIPAPGETLTAAAKNLYFGGKGANQAVAAARMGAATHFLGAVGADEFGAQLKSALAAEDIDIGMVRAIDDVDTGQAYICVADTGENAIVVVPGANHVFRFDGLPAAGGSVFLSQLEMPLEEIASFMRAARGGIRILNGAPAIVEGRRLFDDVEIIVLNETELAGFANTDISGASTLSEFQSAARGLLSRSDQWAVITLGRKGALAISPDQSMTVPAFEMTAVDTTGAGDCFCGVLAAGLAEGMDMTAALTHANAAAGLAVTKRGASPSMPKRDEVIALTASHL